MRDPGIFRQRKGKAGKIIFLFSTFVGIVALLTLLVSIINQVGGYCLYKARMDPDTLKVNCLPLEKQSKAQLLRILKKHLSEGAWNKLDQKKSFTKRSKGEVYDLIIARVVRFRVLKAWTLWESLTKRHQIFTTAKNPPKKTKLKFVFWPNWNFIRRPQSSRPVLAGVRTAILGSLWTIAIAILTAFPMGVMAAIYLEEYATDHWLSRIIQINIFNLAGVPSIIYGILGLAIFVRFLEPFTSGVIFGYAKPGMANGRTIMSAGLTLGLLIIPLIIINAQEAIRAVPRSLREASLALGATQWQTIWGQVLPCALPGILTGTILSISRALGETAPLVVIGASTVIFFDPTSPFSKFTTLPIQIYQWTARPQEAFRFLAAAAILVLLALLLSLNALAIYLRQRYRVRY